MSDFQKIVYTRKLICDAYLMTNYTYYTLFSLYIYKSKEIREGEGGWYICIYIVVARGGEDSG